MQKPFPTLSRRAFLRGACAAVPALTAVPALPRAAEDAKRMTSESGTGNAPEVVTDLVIIGGGLGGCAAALAALRNGLSVVLTEETDWVGGQLTAQAVPPDENPWIETFGGTRSYLGLRQRIRKFYLRNYPLKAEARAQAYLNPGNGWVSLLCHEPRVALAVFQELFAPYVSGSKLTLLLRHQAVEASTAADRVESVRVRSLKTGKELVLQGAIFADATELGELLPLTGTEYVVGAESAKETGEPHAAATAAPQNQQAFTCCFAMDYVKGEDHTIPRPKEYQFWREYVPKLKPPWPGRLLAWEYSYPVTLEPRSVMMDPEKATGLWAYRRIADKGQFAEGTYRGDLTLVNWPQNDYLLGNLAEIAEEDARRHLERAKQLSLSLLYWMQTEAPRPDGGAGWKGLRLRPDIVGTEDGLAKYPYIRESRRIKAEFTILEQHVGTEARMKDTGLSAEEAKAREFKDSVGIGSYRIDLHPSTSGDNYIDISSLPFQIPLGALLPRRVENLLAACKNIGTTHITNGCYRLHPVEWNIGEAGGVLAAFCRMRKCRPREVLKKESFLKEFQAVLTQQGVPLAWPKMTPR